MGKGLVVVRLSWEGWIVRGLGLLICWVWMVKLVWLVWLVCFV